MGISVTHLMIVLVIVLLVFGTGRLPEVGKSLGTAINEFKKTVSDTNRDKDKARAGDGDGEDRTV